MATSISSDKWTLFYKFLQSPRQVGSIFPSSSALTRRMLCQVNWSKIGAMAELGAGTGVFTKAISRDAAKGTKVAVFEKDDHMRQRLAAEHPEFDCFKNAAELTQALKMMNIRHFDCIVSGLPFANFSSDQRRCILDEVQAALRPGGMFITFQYSLQMRTILQERFGSVSISFVARNIPPAFVYVCRQ